MLNSTQKEAVFHLRGPLLIIAGAGTGKTTVITERVKWLIIKKKVTPGEILALTFTDKASREMESRVDQALPYGYTQMWITTFHAFGERVLKQDALQIGLDPGYTMMTGAQNVIFLRKNLFRFDLNYFRPLGNPNKFIEGMLSHFARLKDEDISPDEYIRWAKINNETMKHLNNDEGKIDGEKYLELAEAYRAYEELKIKEGVMDFGDLISNTLKIFRSRKNVLEEYQKRFKYILIDEFQDTNFAQNSLAILLAGPEKNITVVGDDDQAIYRWRGAAISNIIQFRKNFPSSKIVVLNKNYRSTSQILDKSYKMIQNNNPDRLEVKEKINKKLVSVRRIRGEEVEFIHTDRVENEAEEIVNRIRDYELRIKNKLGEKLYSWKDFAILVRANNHADPFVRALERGGIPYQFLGPGVLFRQPEVKDLIAYLTFLDNPESSVALYRVLCMTVFDLDSGELVIINNFARKIGLSLFEAVDVIRAGYLKNISHWSVDRNYQNYIPNISDQTKIKLVKFLDMFDRHMKLLKSDSAGQILYYFLEDTGILKTLVHIESVREEKTVLNISKFFDELKAYEGENEDTSVSAVVDWIGMSLELGESPITTDTDWSQNDAVNILTVHSAKGLEFPVVFLVNLVTNRFPTSLRREQLPIPDALVKEILPEGDYHLEEERRLFYVGMTRAKDKLFLTASNYYGEGKRERKISPFVVETMGEKILAMKQSNNLTMKQLSILDWKKGVEKDIRQVNKPPEYLSYSQIDSFSTCPLQYKYRYVIKIPVPTSAAGSFGTSMHLTLQEFYEMVKKGEKPDKGKLLSLLKENWIPIGYRNKEYEVKMKVRGEDMLTYYFDNFYDTKSVSSTLEQVFKIKLSPTLKIGGKIDRIDILPDGKMEIIDYKTGKRPTDREIKKNLQMTVYALAATDPGIYNKKPEDIILSFYFLEAREKVSDSRTKEQLEEAKIKLSEKAVEIAHSNFQPKVGPWCDYCDFRLICEAWQ